MKTIETERLFLRKWSENDVLDVFEYAKDSRVGPNAGWAPHKDAEESKRVISMFMEAGDVYAIELKDEKKVIGSIGFHERYPDEFLKDFAQREIGYVINPNYWGNGYAPESVNALLHYGFHDLFLDIIWCGHYSFNSNSKRVIEKCGFTYRFNRDITLPLLENKEVNCLFYYITKENFLRK